MSAANRNVAAALLTRKTPKEIFVKYYTPFSPAGAVAVLIWEMCVLPLQPS